ncbi:Endonuclease/Exonuclease/phosphatase family protein [Ferrimonas sediminum]|uniref:Endonuclease/Exonuclease/phosphatase family protein n=1 Tax=Ferrimonas sediminum TaxID=718193 RepID=A0A1G9B288_9GAMM|nr:endonuclease/exonuclease/phosphatase family protein [Ferrimonas sediminum]SDK33637.1 Endonuclease/Exonuclease/phosphatase family protein [Ferrimonas sediminum]
MTAPSTLRIATFNASMEAGNYVEDGAALDPTALARHLATGKHPQIRNVAEIIQRVRPDILLLNEFDYIADATTGAEAFINHYLKVGQKGQAGIDYPYHYCAPVNAGEPSSLDIDGDGVASGTLGDAYGFGAYPGQYGMLVLSRYPIDHQRVRTFRQFLWHRMPAALRVTHPDGRPFYDEATRLGMRLSSKSHWDVPITVGEQRLHLLAAHPTPPVFDGPERRNAARNHDEIRLWADYIDPLRSDYLEDDNGQGGGLAAGSRFVIVGDYNASAVEGDSHPGAIEQLLHHPGIQAEPAPGSDGGRYHSPDNPDGAQHTAAWRARVDYVLPSRSGWQVRQSGVFWPTTRSRLHRLVANRRVSSDHRLVWLDAVLVP